MAINLERASDEEKARLCQTYTKLGCFCLPFLWFVNVVWFCKDAFCRAPFALQNEIRRSVYISAAGCVCWSAIFVGWQIVFQTNRVAWGALGDYLSCVVPRGFA